MSNTKLASSRVSPASARARRVPAGGMKCSGYTVLSSVTPRYQLTISRKAVESLSQSEEVAS